MYQSRNKQIAWETTLNNLPVLIKIYISAVLDQIGNEVNL